MSSSPAPSDRDEDVAAQGQHGALSGPEPGEAQGEAAASRSCQGSLDGTAPTPGPESTSAATPSRRMTKKEAALRLWLKTLIEQAVMGPKR